MPPSLQIYSVFFLFTFSKIIPGVNFSINKCKWGRVTWRKTPLAKLSKNKFLPETGPCSSWANTFTKFCEQLDLRNILIGLPEGFIHIFQTYKMLPCLTAFLWSGHVVQVTLTLVYSFKWVKNSSCKSSTGRLTIGLPKISSFSNKF